MTHKFGIIESAVKECIESAVKECIESAVKECIEIILVGVWLHVFAHYV